MDDAVLEEYRKVPVITRAYVTGCVATTLAIMMGAVSPFSLFYSLPLVLEGQVWRLLTSFFFFGSSLGVDYIMHMYFLLRYSSNLEEGSFRTRPADYLYMLLLGSAALLALGALTGVHFLGHSLSSMLTYVWSRRNPHARMNIMGVFTFRAPFLPWVLMAFSLLMGSSPLLDLLGIVAGHLYYFAEDVYPNMRPDRLHLLKTPRCLVRLFLE